MRWLGLLCAAVLYVGPQNGLGAEIRSGSGHGERAQAARRTKKHEARNEDASLAAIASARTLIRDSAGYDVVLIDPELSTDPERVRSLDAFIVREDDGRLRPKIYINRESAIVRQAARGDDFYVSVLAAVIVHEMEHLNGGNEDTARFAERQFLRTLIAQGRIVWSDGERYLALLQQQRERPR